MRITNVSATLRRDFGTMNTTETNREVVRDAFASWEAGDFSAVLDLMAEDLEWTIIGTTAISGTYGSRQAFQDAVGNMLRRAFKSPIKPTIRKVLADGSDVAVFFSSHAETHAGPDYDQVYCWALEVIDGRIRRGTAYLDTALIDAVVSPHL